MAEHRLTNHGRTLTVPVHSDSRWKGVHDKWWSFGDNRDISCRGPPHAKAKLFVCFEFRGADPLDGSGGFIRARSSSEAQREVRAGRQSPGGKGRQPLHPPIIIPGRIIRLETIIVQTFVLISDLNG